MNKCSLLIATALMQAVCFAKTRPAMEFSEYTPLWPSTERIPDFQKHQKAFRDELRRQPACIDNRSMPYLEWYAPQEGAPTNDTCVILISGGSYNSWCDGYWLDIAAKRFLAKGVTCVSLVYRTPRPKNLPIYKTAWQDGQRAVRIVRSQAGKRGYSPEKIGALGFSAGSHLTVLLATSSTIPSYEKVDDIDDIPANINFAIPVYTAYGLTDGLEGPNSRNGDSPDAVLTDVFAFDSKTCSMCLFHGGEDAYSPITSTRVYRKLNSMKIPSEIHLFADRGHGFFYRAKEGSAASRWLDRVDEYMMKMGLYGELKPMEKILDRFSSDGDLGIREKQSIWPEGEAPDPQAHQDTAPFIEWHIPKQLSTKAIQIIFSGGGYRSNSPESSEVKPARRYFNLKGMTVVTMQYRSPRPKGGLAKHMSAWQDLQRAIRLVRSQAEEKGLDPNRIGVMGSSAGGHLALLGAANSRSRSYLGIDGTDNIPCNVQWAVAIYPAYMLQTGVGIELAHNQLSNSFVMERFSPEFVFDPDTCPVVFIHGDRDTTARVSCSIATWEHLRRMGVQCDLHTLVHETHSFERKASPGTAAYTYLDRIWEFLTHKGFND